MKRLRNIGIYYAVFGILLMISFIFTNLWRISIIGIILLLVYFFLKIVCKKKKIVTKLTKQQLQFWDFILVILPFIYILLVSWYVWRPYNQTIILPRNYEGIVVIQYDRSYGQSEKWVGGFLGIGASRIIEVDSTGTAKTQFKFHNNAIPFLGLKQTYHNRGGLKIYYENDLWCEIKKVSFFEWENNRNKECVYFTGFDYYPLIIFVITKPKNYDNYFINKDEKNILQEKYNKNPYKNYPPDKHELNQKYAKYYKLDYQYKELTK
ncbi:hypothetical protein [Tenacibaculum finnmarkense]|uniref:hypothetical protein n=2 Tax=Tenacibaculum finnmarkense TaxID=2781243 RepID=UPI001EFB0C09|nr:hypothetical protein [Tenacibaculum finnmarkense]MCG8713901.1 hypothetical protein [Tenacibaculum finnmarkense]MCG8727022.1 hypothetical protein [Tenacibaculum finnmarkense]MCG8729694.1 hypothetical protein [Tenacibaculum finnmarkense]MCG8740124.1 hypothetical protein [Tenacibaculum finnmarkense]MCG8745377.1 hypothetical protein [Tenacibaculum finnmarkense]